MTAALAVESLSVWFGRTRALDAVSIEAAAGEILAIVGPNGSGKTTLLDAVGGLVRPRSGRVLIAGRDVTSMPPHRRARLGMTRVFQDSRLYCSLTIPEAVAVAAGRGSAERVDDALRAFGLDSAATAFAAELSTGTRRMVELAAAAARRSSLLLLDEPTTGLAQPEKGALASVLREWSARSGLTMVVVEHDLDFVRAIAGRVALLDFGSLVCEGSLDDVLTRASR
jgi:ABC-type branched-subunit amino acid transport system ATPase component